MLKTFNNRLMVLICILVIRNCFEFRISSFELLILFILGALCVFARGIFFPIPIEFNPVSRCPHADPGRCPHILARSPSL